MNFAKGTFTTIFFVKCLFLVILIWAQSASLWASKEYPTINELIEQGEFTDELANTATNSQSPEIPPQSTDENNDPVTVPPPTDASQVHVPNLPIPLSEKVVMIGRPPYISVKGMQLQVKGLRDFLRKELGAKDVRIVTAKNYAAVLNALERGSIDFAWLGPTAFVIGNERTALIPIAQAKRRTGSTYHGVFIARKDSRILGIKGIKGKVIGFVDPESASGYLYPLYLLKRFKINPYKDCRKVEFLRKHDAIVAAVLSRRIDVGVCLEDTIETIKDRKILDQIMILGKTDELPSDIVACRADCPASLRDKFRDALLKTGTLTQTASLTTDLLPIMEFLPVNGVAVNAVRDVLEAVKEIRKP